MNRKFYIKIVTGYRKDQFVTVPMQEAHKAYYLFRNPEKRGVFSNGVPVIGSEIKQILPDWNATMGWNRLHDMDQSDWNAVSSNGISAKMNFLIEKAATVSSMIDDNQNLKDLPLQKIMESAQLFSTQLAKDAEVDERVKVLAQKLDVNH